MAAVDESSPRRAGYRRSAGTPRGEARRRELLDRLVDDLAVNGLVDFSLRRAARAAGTAHKVLLYHFDGAEDLLQQAIWQLAGPAIRTVQRAPGAELVRLPGGHYAPFLDAHEQAAAAEMSFLRRHVLAAAAAPSGS